MEPDKHKGRVIVTYGRSLIALMIAQSLGSRGIEVIGCDSVGMTVLSFSKFVSKNSVYRSPEKDEAGFLDDLEEIIRKNRPDDDCPYILIPSFSDAEIIARHKPRFEGLVTVAIPDAEAINKVNPKDHFAKTMLELGVPSPKTWLPKDENELAQAQTEISFPVFIKPPDDVGGRGISKVKNNRELQEAFSDLQKRYPGEQILVQSMAQGTDYCFCGLYDRGELVASMVCHNLRKLPRESGAGVVRETVDSARFDPLAQKLMGPLKWHGVAEIDFVWDGAESSTPQMIEVNSRFWAGLDHSVKSGIDFPWLLYQLFTTGQVDSDQTAEAGYKSSLPGLAAMARIEDLFATAIHFDEMEEQWPLIKQHLKARELKKAGDIFARAMRHSFSLGEAAHTLQAMLKESKEAEKISYAKDDPFIGLGILFILASLVRYGKLPPEVTR